MKIIPNKYHDRTKICWSCGFPIANNDDHRAIVCHTSIKAERSNCQKFKDRYDQNIWRGKRPDHWCVSAKNKRQSKQKNNPQEAMRTCLRCDEDENGAIMFLSKGTHNRICDKCSNKQQSINVVNLSRAGDNIPGLEFMYGIID